MARTKRTMYCKTCGAISTHLLKKTCFRPGCTGKMALNTEKTTGTLRRKPGRKEK